MSKMKQAAEFFKEMFTGEGMEKEIKDVMSPKKAEGFDQVLVEIDKNQPKKPSTRDSTQAMLASKMMEAARKDPKLKEAYQIALKKRLKAGGDRNKALYATAQEMQKRFKF